MNAGGYTITYWNKGNSHTEELDISLTKYQQLMFLPELKIERPSLKNVHSQVLTRNRR